MVMRYRVVERGHRRDELGEGLFWSVREQALYWTDILGRRLNRWSCRDGAFVSWTLPEMIGWVIERTSGEGLIAGLQSGFHELVIEGSDIRLARIANPEPDLPDNRLNDAKADASGRLWAGSMPVSADRPTGSLFRLDTDRKIHRMDTGYTIANGPAISPDGATLYHTDTGLGVIYRFALHDDGSLGPRQVFIRFEESWGRPDGMTVDAEGGLWIAHWGGGRISRFTPEGQRERSLVLPASQITNVCFGGSELDRLFVTSAADGRHFEPHAGDLFEVDPEGVRGLAPGLYGG